MNKKDFSRLDKSVIIRLLTLYVTISYNIIKWADLMAYSLAKYQRDSEVEKWRQIILHIRVYIII